MLDEMCATLGGRASSIITKSLVLKSSTPHKVPLEQSKVSQQTQ